MIDYLGTQRGKLVLLLGGLALGYTAAKWQQADPMDFDPWAVD